MADTGIDFQKALNPQQYEVVVNGQGPCLVLAGAGSGKTRVLVYRLAYLLSLGVKQQNIMLVTFTNKAAREMITRSEVLLRQDLKKLWAGTFHHIGNIILRRQAKLLGYSADFSIIDRQDSQELVADCIEELGFHKSGKLFPKKDMIVNIYSLAVNSLQGIEDIIGRFYPHIQEYALEVKKIIGRFKKKKKESNVMDFTDLLYLWNKVLDLDFVRSKYAGIFENILVDEYQDTNRLQFEILKKLASRHKNILAVGDDAQSIYSFRAADINNILDFPSVFENTKIFKLETNYRSTPRILNLANEIIKHNKAQFPKELSAVNKDGPLPVLVKVDDVYKQAEFVAKEIANFNFEGVNLADIAILFRSRFQALEMEVELIKRNIPYIIRGGVRFFEQAHIKDVLSFLKILVNPSDEISFKRALCLYEAIGRKSAYKIWVKLVKEKKSSESILASLGQKQKAGFKKFSALFFRIKKESLPCEIINIICNSYRDYCHVSFDNPEDRLSDLEELAKMARKYNSIKGFLEDISSYEEFKGESLAAGSGGSREVLTLSTIHQAKGLEWTVVFLIGFREYDFPHPKSLKDDRSLEEERRLFYVAVTRTRKFLYITHPLKKYSYREGMVITRPSMFIRQISPDKYKEMDFTRQNAYYSGGGDDDFYI